MNDESRSTLVNRRWQLSLSTMLLLVTLFAVGAAFVKTRHDRIRVQQLLGTMRSMTRELAVDDPTQIAIVRRLPTLSNELIFDVHIPARMVPTQIHRLCLAVEEIVDVGPPDVVFPRPTESVGLQPGTHSIELCHFAADKNDVNSEHRFEVLVDGEVALNVKRPADWQVSNGWSSNGSITETQSFDAGKTVQLFRRRNNEPTKNGSRSTPPNQPANGILLWIES